MTILGCIFDLDGVLCDTSAFHFLSWSKTAESLGVSFGNEDNHRLRGVSRADSLRYILNKASRSVDEIEFNRLMAEKNDHYLRLIHNLSPNDIYDGVMNLLEDLKGEGVKIGLGSSSKNARLVLSRLGIDSMFDVVVDGNDVQRSKPDPEVFLKGADSLDMNPTTIVVFEDAPMGLQAARIGGFKTIGIGSNELIGLADIVLPNMKSLSFSTIQNYFSQET